MAAIDRLVAQDGERLNARNQVDIHDDALAYRGQDAVVARVLALGADVGLKSDFGWLATHWACYGKQASSLALLLGAGASLDVRSNHGLTPLMAAAVQGASDCVTLLVARGGDGANAQQDDGLTALHMAGYSGHCQVVSLLLQVGGDPTIRTNWGRTALETAQAKGHQQCVDLLKSALAGAQRNPALFKARALLDAAHATNKARTDAQTKGHPAAVQQQEAMAAAPVYLKQRVAQAQELPGVRVVEAGEDEELAACVKYALGLEGGGGVVLEGQQELAVGMLPEVFVELLELLVPKWDPSRKGRPLGEGV